MPRNKYAVPPPVDTERVAGLVVDEMFGGVDDLDDFDDDDLDDDEKYGVLGIALTKKAKGKKWAKQIGDLERRLYSLRRLREKGVETAGKKRKGPISLFDKRKKIDVDKQIDKLEKDHQKAVSEWKKLDLGMSPAAFLKSIGEEIIGVPRAPR